MKELGIVSLNIISDEEIILESIEIGVLRAYLNNNKERQAGLVEQQSKPTPKKAFLSEPAITMAKNLHILLLNIDKFPADQPLPTMNPINIYQVESYNQVLLGKLVTKSKEEIEAEIEDPNNNYFLKIHKDSSYEEDEEINLEEIHSNIISEINLLKLSEDENFNIVKEEAIKFLVSHLVKVYDKVLQDHIQMEIKRRTNFRGYINFLLIYRKIEIYCNLYKTRGKGETIKTQTNKKIIEYSSDKIKQTDISTIIRTAKRIEKLMNLSNNNWCIVDAFPNLDVSFFKSTSVSVAAYECWLKLVETGWNISEEEGQKIYLEKKAEENRLRESNLTRVYSLALNSASYDKGSPRYYPDPGKDEDEVELMVEDIMVEDN